ncbi:MAG TPA: thioesterase domain-containing protein [Pseudonocardiaceae bacterium]
MSGTANNPWVARLRPASDGQVRLICFAHAGGGAATFRGWVDDLSKDIDMCVVRLPGRESRLREQQIRKMDELVPTLASALEGLLDGPYAFFGYCSGALTAFELTRYLLTTGQRPPERLFACACPSPRLVLRDSGVHQLQGPKLAEHLKALGIIPATILDEPSLFAMFEDSVRADYEVYETATYLPGDPLPLPISVFGADEDPSTNVPTLLDWRDETSDVFTFRLFRGTHSFFEADRRIIVRAVADELGLDLDSHPDGAAPRGVR